MYSFIIDNIIFYPFFEECSLIANVEDNWRKIEKFGGELVFSGQEFDYLHNKLLNNINQLDFILYKNNNIEYIGFLNLRGTYNLKEKTCRLKVIENNRYTKIQKNKNLEFNLLNFSRTYTLTLERTSLEITRYSDCTLLDELTYLNTQLQIQPFELSTSYVYYSFINPTISLGKYIHVWQYIIYEYYINEIISSETDLSPENYIDSHPSEFPLPLYLYTYIRSYNDVCTTPPYHVWIYKKQIFNFNALSFDDKCGFYNEYLNFYVRPLSVVYNLTQNFSRFLKFYDILQDILSEIDDSININESTYCTYFNNNFPDLLNLYLAQKSDIKRPNSTSPATILNCTFEKLMELLKKMFNLDWYIDNSNNFLLVHPSELSNEFDYELTDIKYNRLKQYIIEDTDNISKELWKFEKTTNRYFSSEYIEYSLDTINQKDIEIKDVCNDILGINNSPDISDSGYVFAINDGTNHFLYTEVNYELELNGMLSAWYLVRNFMKTGDRPYKYDINNEALSQKAFREHIEIDFNLEYFSELDFSKLVKTQLTEEMGIIGARKINVTQNLNKNFATIKLKF